MKTLLASLCVVGLAGVVSAPAVALELTPTHLTLSISCVEMILPEWTGDGTSGAISSGFEQIHGTASCSDSNGADSVMAGVVDTGAIGLSITGTSEFSTSATGEGELALRSRRRSTAKQCLGVGCGRPLRTTRDLRGLASPCGVLAARDQGGRKGPAGRIFPVATRPGILDIRGVG
jgi:hypothetical protein